MSKRNGISSLVSSIAGGAASAEEHIANVVEQAVRLNSCLGAFRELIQERALADAREIDRAVREGRSVGPLAGLSVAIKENVDTVPAVCSSGMRMRKKARPASDSWMTRKLREAGAVIIGVTVSDPGAFGCRTDSVINPADPELAVGGSSGGSGAALAAGMCELAIGTDTGGSIRVPAACCGVVGLKPTWAHFSLAGVFPLVPSMDTVGPMTRTAEDLEFVTFALNARRAENSPVATIGYDPDYFSDAAPQVKADFAAFLDMCARGGFECREVHLPKPADVALMHSTVFSVESSAAFQTLLPGEEVDYPELARGTLRHASTLSVREYLDACRERGVFSRIVADVFRQVDLLIAPTLPVYRPARAADGFWLGGNWTDFTFALVRYTALFNATGNPAVSMPVPGQSHGSSIQLIGPHGGDSHIVRFAAEREREWA